MTGTGGWKSWFTAAELAELALPGLPRTKRKINERAAAEGWALKASASGEPLARPRQARGGGLEYHIDLLPAAARAALVAQGVKVVADVSDAPETRAQALWRWYDAQNDKTHAEAERRLKVVQLAGQYEAAALTRTAAIAQAAAQSGVSDATLWNWIGMVKGVAPADWLPHLAPRRSGGCAEARIDARAWQLFLSDYLRPERPTLAECYRRTEKWAALEGIALPHMRTFRRHLESDVDGRVIVAKREGAEALRRLQPAQRRSVMDLHALEAVNIDGHKFDVFCRWPDGSVKRPMMVAIQDLYSRKILAWRVAESENAIDTRLAFGALFRDWGIPRHCVLDNGRAFAAKWITGGAKTRFRFKIKEDEPLGLLTALGIEIHWATPYRGQSKPIERAFLDLTDIIARHPMTVGAYTGNKPDAKPENYGSAAVPIDAFRELVDAGIAAHNARQGRRTETAQGCSFDDVFAESYSHAAIGKATPEQLRLAMLAAENRRCQSHNGEITLEGNRYWADALLDHAGKRVTVRFDPDNLHSEIHVYALDGRFIVTAPAIETTGFFDKEAAKRRRAQEAEWRRTVREAEKAQDLLSVGAIAAMLSDGTDTAPEPAPEARVVRPVRVRGSAALAQVHETAAAPAPVSVDRLVTAMTRLRVVE